MSTTMEIPAWRGVVERAASGDAAAWVQLVEWFQDTAVGLAVGFSGDLQSAHDIAQEAFTLAFRHLGDLEDPQAFPAWFRQLVRTASSRARPGRARGRPAPLQGIDPVDPKPGPDDEAISVEEQDRVRRAVEALPEPERCVVALHYLAGLGYRDVAAFLGVTESAAKKRAWSARRRLEELLPMTTGSLAAHRPSNSTGFRDTVVLFRAIKAADTGGVTGVIARHPELVHATEDWTLAEGLASGLGYAGRASALIRAAQLGHLDMVRLLVEAGAPVDGACSCANGETPLWVAVVAGHHDVVDFLLEAGADPNQAAFEGAMPLHVAVHREFDSLVPRLLAAGADPNALDAGGRTPGDWAALKRSRALDPSGDVLWSRIRAVDLFAPLARGSVQHWPSAYGLGQVVLLFGVAQNLPATELWVIGFAHGPYDAAGFETEAEETGVRARIRLVPAGPPPRRRMQFKSIVDELVAAPGDKLVGCLRAPGFTHDTTLVLPTLAADASVLATIVIEPFSPEPAPVPAALPEGFTGRVAFSPVRARRRLWPAVDPLRTISRTYPSARHADLADRARQLLDRYQTLDPTLELPEPGWLPEPALAARGQALVRYLAHPFRLAEPFTSAPATETDLSTLLDDVEALCLPRAQWHPVDPQIE